MVIRPQGLKPEIILRVDAGLKGLLHQSALRRLQVAVLVALHLFANVLGQLLNLLRLANYFHRQSLLAGFVYARFEFGGEFEQFVSVMLQSRLPLLVHLLFLRAAQLLTARIIGFRLACSGMRRGWKTWLARIKLAPGGSTDHQCRNTNQESTLADEHTI